tara:strand:- start:52 stop:168 length:117 start_codon:yes stop_codon:yes gene_type:complete
MLTGGTVVPSVNKKAWGEEKLIYDISRDLIIPLSFNIV